MSQSEWHNLLKNCELVCSSYYFKWPKVANTVIEAEKAIADLAEKAFSLTGHADILEKGVTGEAEQYIDRFISG